MAYLTTLHDLIKELETHSSIIGSMGLAQQLQDCPLPIPALEGALRSKYPIHSI
jgi:hypothetical protein